MIEVLMALMAFFGIGDGEDPDKLAFYSDNQQIIRAIDSNELREFNALEAHDADKWFVQLICTNNMEQVAEFFLLVIVMVTYFIPS